MKKILEDELMGLAHRILRLRGRDDLEQMKKLAGEVYEKLSILTFAEKHLTDPQPNISFRAIEEALQSEPEKLADKPEDLQAEPKAYPNPPATTPTESFTDDADESSWINEADEESLDAEENPEVISDETGSAEDEDDLAQEESGPLKITEEDSSEIDLRDIAVHYDDLPQFEPIPLAPLTEENQVKIHDEQPIEEETSKEEEEEEEKDGQSHQNVDLFSGFTRPQIKNHQPTTRKSLNDSIKIGLQFGINDRMLFINNLFEGRADDFNRVISQLNTFEKYEEAKSFIEEQIKPDYNWEEKEKYEERFYQALAHRMED